MVGESGSSLIETCDSVRYQEFIERFTAKIGQAGRSPNWHSTFGTWSLFTHLYMRVYLTLSDYWDITEGSVMISGCCTLSCSLVLHLLIAMFAAPPQVALVLHRPFPLRPPLKSLVLVLDRLWSIHIGCPSGFNLFWDHSLGDSIAVIGQVDD